MIPLVDLKLQYQQHKEEFDAAIARVSESAQFINGPECKQFVQEFSEYCGNGYKGYTALCGNGTDALYLAIISLLGKGNGTKEIIIVPNTFIATVEAIINAGYKPKFVDIYPDTYLMDVGQLENTITENTVGIIPVHLYGQMCNMPYLMEIAGKHNLKVIEDAAQSHGATWGLKGPGLYGHAACFSFFPGKNLGCWGDGGAVFTTDAVLSETIRAFANHGRYHDKYTHYRLGTNSRLDEIQAAILRVKLEHLNEWNASRVKNARNYTRAIFQIKNIVPPFVSHDATHVYHQYVINADGRDTMANVLKIAGISTGIHYPIPLYKQPALKYLNISVDDFPVTENAVGRILSLPMYPELTYDQIEYITGVIKGHMENNERYKH
jgi:dTDP-4-amino-4,6-dideoxygalactose transaminase